MSENRLYKTMYEVCRVINSSLDPTDVLEKIAERVTWAMDAKGCFIRILSRDGKRLKPAAYYGLSKRYALKGEVEVEKSGMDKEVMKGEIVTVKDAATDPRFQYKDEAKEEGLTSLLVAPMTAANKTIIGVLRVYASQTREFTEEEREFITAIANLSAIALENARMFKALKRANELTNAYNYQVFEE